MGALTLKQFSNSIREWELAEGEGIDPTDSFGVDLRLSIRENQIFLAEPYNPNTPWLTDRGRIFFDGMFDNNIAEKVEWTKFFEYFAEFLYFANHLSLKKKNSFFLIVVFENISLEILNMLYILEQNNSFIKLRKVDNHYLNSDFESNLFLNNSVEKSKLHLSNLGLLLNTDTRHEGYVLNLNLRLRFLKGDFKLLSIGSALDITLPVYHLGSNIRVLKSINEGTHLSCQDIKGSKFPILITNTELFKRKNFKNFANILKTTNFLSNIWNGVNVLNNNLSSAGINLLNNFIPLSSEDYVNFLGFYSINAELNSIGNFKKLVELKLLNVSSISSNSFVDILVEQNVKSTDELKYSNNYYYLPNNLFLEDNETYINTQGLIKRTTKLINFKKDSKSNWQIIRKIYSISKTLMYLNKTQNSNYVDFEFVNLFNYKNYINLQYFPSQNLISFSFYLNKSNKMFINNFDINFKSSQIKIFETKMKYWLDDFFVNNCRDSFSYNSSVLNNCSKISRSITTNFF